MKAQLVKLLFALVMMIWGTIQCLNPEWGYIAGTVWMVGAILLIWMPIKEAK